METSTAKETINNSLSRHAELPLSAVLAAHSDLHLEAHSKDGKSWVVHFRGAEFKDHPNSGTLSSFSGSGRSSDVAQVDLCNKLGGKIMVIDGYETRSGRQLFQLPQKVTLD